MLTVSTIIKFLAFDAEAIKKIAGSSKATWVGFLFVISAGFAREYDGEFLVAEPWHLLIPVAASLLGCFLMVLFVFALAWFRNVRYVPFLEVFRGFLNCYWMTAPLALLYAIPVERFVDPGDATRANLILLGVVAFWRVALMVRCVQVLFNTHPVAAFIPVILFSDILAMAAIWLVPGPIFLIMGGIRLTESESIILDLRIWMILIGYGTFLIWLIGYLGLYFRSAPWIYFKSEPDFESRQPSVTRGMWGLVAIALLVWIPFLPFTQHEQWLRWKSEKLIRAKDFAAFSKLTRDYPETAFPPHWDPPPRIGYGETRPYVFLVLAGLQSNRGAQWMLDRYLEKMEKDIQVWAYWGPDSLDRYSDAELAAFVDVISKLPNPRDVADNFNDSVQIELDDSPNGNLTESRIASLKRLQQLGQPEEPDD